jgi:hypothetical protein
VAPKGCSRFFAPASCQSSKVLLILASTEGMDAVLSLKVHAFLSCQISQTMRITMDLRAFLSLSQFGFRSMLLRAYKVNPAVRQESGFSAAQPDQSLTVLQTCMVTGHLQNRCIESSKFLKQNWQKYPFSHPRLCNLSLHHRRSSRRSQRKSFKRPGAQGFQMKVLNSGAGVSWHCSR